MKQIIGIITMINPLLNTLEVNSNGVVYYFKPIKTAVLIKYKVGETFIYEGF